MATIIAVTNNKGGVGKTTVSGNLAAALAELGHDTLLGDLDSQANLSGWYGAGKTHPDHMGEFLSATLAEAARWPTMPVAPRLQLLPSHRLLGEFQTRIKRKQPKPQYHLLADRLQQLTARRFEYVVLDCPPNITDGMTDYALCAAQAYILPADPEPFSVEGLVESMNYGTAVQRDHNPALRFAGFIFPRYNPAVRGALRQRLLAAIGNGYGPETILGNVGEDAHVFAAQGFKKTIYQHEPESRAALAYLKIAQNLINRLQNHG